MAESYRYAQKSTIIVAQSISVKLRYCKDQRLTLATFLVLRFIHFPRCSKHLPCYSLSTEINQANENLFNGIQLLTNPQCNQLDNSKTEAEMKSRHISRDPLKPNIPGMQFFPKCGMEWGWGTGRLHRSHY